MNKELEQAMEPLDFTGHTPGPWEVWTGCSWRRIGTQDQAKLVICPTNHPIDRHPDLQASGEDLELAAAAPRLAADRETLQREVRRLRKAQRGLALTITGNVVEDSLAVPWVTLRVFRDELTEARAARAEEAE